MLIYVYTNKAGRQASELACASALLPRETQPLAGLLQSSALASGLRRGQRPQEGAGRLQLGMLSCPAWDKGMKLHKDLGRDNDVGSHDNGNG